MKPDYKNWVPKGMIASFAASAGVAFVLFLIFGASFSIFSGAEALEGYRAPLSALALFCFALSAFFFFKKPRACSLQSGRKKWILIYALLGALLAFMLTYPEILGEFYA